MLLATLLAVDEVVQRIHVAARQRVAELLARAESVSIVGVQSEITTQQAADLLNVSRPFLIRILEEQKIPFTKTGRHRRVRAVDLFAYKAERDHQRSWALSDMAALDAAHGLI